MFLCLVISRNTTDGLDKIRLKLPWNYVWSTEVKAETLQKTNVGVNF